MKDAMEKEYPCPAVFPDIETNRNILRQIFCSSGRLVDSRGCPMEILLAFLDKIGNPKTFAANLQNSSGRPVES